MKSNEGFDLIVIGAGIAGLAIAEIFSRSGKKVLLLEKNMKICQEASGAHHGWFHFGSLYSIFPNNQFLKTLVGGIDDLLEFYSEFPGMNICIGQQQKLEFENIKGKWFRDEPIEYIVSARNNSDFSMNRFNGVKDYAKKIFYLFTWELAIKQFVSRHQRFHKFKWGSRPASSWIPRAGWFDYSRDVISKPKNFDINLDDDTHFRILGFDRPMDSTCIASDLLKSFLCHGGELRVDSEVINIKKSGNCVVTKNNTFIGKNVVIASGHFTNDLLEERTGVKVLISPLLIVYPPVSDKNFVRLTPFIEKSVNHILHEIDGRKYSVIGGGFFADPDNDKKIEKAEIDLLNMARKVFPKFDSVKHYEIYFSHKTEMISKPGERNYQYNIKNLGNNVYSVLPGKYSLGFSLAVNFYKKIMKKQPKNISKFNPNFPVEEFIEPMKHSQIVLNSINVNKTE